MITAVTMALEISLICLSKKENKNGTLKNAVEIINGLQGLLVSLCVIAGSYFRNHVLEKLVHSV